MISIDLKDYIYTQSLIFELIYLLLINPSLNISLSSFLQPFGIHDGIGPEFLSIIMRCSTSSWVGKRRSPVNNSEIIQAMDQTSLSSFHSVHCNITYGDLYCLVLIIELCLSVLCVAPPKSIILTVFLTGRQYFSTLGCAIRTN